MSGVLQVGKQQLGAQEVVDVIAKSPLLPQVLREIIIEKAIAPLDYHQSQLPQVTQQLQQQKHLQGHTPEQLEAIAIRQLKLDKFKQTNWGHKVEAYFLSCKDQLDQVVFSLIQTKSAEVAQELYFRIREGEKDFSDLALKYSQGPESRTNGMVGPIKLKNLHPSLAKTLLSSQVKQLSPIFRVDKSFVLVRLEKFIPAQLNDSLRHKLLDEMFEKWIQDTIAQESFPSLELSSSSTLSEFTETINQPPESSPAEIVEEKPTEVDSTANSSAIEPEISAINLEKQTVQSSPETSSLVIATPSPTIKPKRSNKLAGLLFLALAMLGLGGLYFHYTERVAIKKSTPANAAIATKQVVPPEDAFRVGVNHALKAADLTQSAQFPSQWDKVVNNWQQAITLMENVPSNSPDYDVAQQKLAEYQNYLKYAQQSATKSGDNFHLAVNYALKAADLTQLAQSPSQWDRVASNWQQAIALMELVEEQHPQYTVAQQKVKEYQDYLKYAQQKAVIATNTQ